MKSDNLELVQYNGESDFVWILALKTLETTARLCIVIFLTLLFIWLMFIGVWTKKEFNNKYRRI